MEKLYKTKYTVCCQPNEFALVDAVQKRLDEGWELEGGVSCTVYKHLNGSESHRFYQAMSRWECVDVQP